MYQRKQNICKKEISITMEHAAKEWLAEKRLFVKPSTYARYTHALQLYVLPYLGREAVEELDSIRVNLYLKMLLEEGRADKKGGLSPKTVNDIYVIVKAIIRLAEETYHIPGHIIRASNLWKRTNRVPVLDQFNQSKLEKYLLSRKENPSCLGILLCLYTGIRLGEICALKWDNIHLESGFIRISSTIQRIQNVESGRSPKTRLICSQPKTVFSSREIPIPGFLLDILKKYCPKADLNTYFLTGSYHFIEPRTYQNHFKGYLRNTGIPDINFHALRHTFATRCVAAGVDIKSLSEILGHSSVQMTLNYYVHPSLEDKRRQIERIGQPWM